MKTSCLLLTVIMLISVACNLRIPNGTTSDCRDYLTLVKENWKQTEEGFYSFRENTKYWDANIYPSVLNESCLIGISKTDLINLFGMPTKRFTYSKKDAYLDVAIYCTDKTCLDSKTLYSGHSIRFLFTADGSLSSIGTSPAISSGIRGKQ